MLRSGKSHQNIFFCLNDTLKSGNFYPAREILKSSSIEISEKSVYFQLASMFGNDCLFRKGVLI